ncbi:hypothetical protein [Solwaraspora sp. WMMA2065]|uniref:hypothetical protein n=1 Tax=Solwaraspora sp. WMMA2065 TaxID=3015166 RepID=UPI00259B42AC|nr:hypothetical protein [Solwaraspora sp. WMMA2065]WJK33593.1 hypothetical protein O7610_23355 [Solwaraspora sp. WMMA2065]
MEEQSPDAEPRRSRAPRARTPTAGVTPPAAIAPVLFQPPSSAAGSAESPAKKATPAKKTAAKKAAAKKATPAAEPTAAEKPAARKTTPRKTAAKKTAPTKKTTAKKAAPAPDPAGTPPPGPVPGGTLRQLLARPAYAPELLALAAVERIGPAARDWAARLRDDYPAASDDALARLAARRFTRLAGAGAAVATAGGLLGPALELVTLGWTQAAVTLHVAAAYRHDPTDRDRAAELLALTGMQPDVAAAHAALDAAGRPTTDDAEDPALRLLGGAQRFTEAVSRLTGGGWALLRLPARLLPGGRALVAWSGDTLLLERLAARASARYRPVTPAAPVTAS